MRHQLETAIGDMVGFRKISIEAREEAAAWVERLTAAEPSERLIAELKTWLAADPDHRMAYEQARAIWVDLDRVDFTRGRRMRQVAWGGAIAASFAALFFWASSTHDLSSPVGAVRAVRLADGTKLWIDSDAAVDLDLTSEARTIRLARGRVAVEVAKDARPFAVVAGDARITDIGTIFSVDRGDTLDVRVESGVVDVARDGSHLVIQGGQGLRLGAGDPVKSKLAADDFAWRNLRLRLDNVPLREAVARLNRYYPSRIVLGSGVDADARVSGTLFVDRPEVALATLMRSRHLQATHLIWVTILSPAKKSTPAG